MGSLILRHFIAPNGPSPVIKLGLERFACNIQFSYFFFAYFSNSSQQQVQQKLQFETECTAAITGKK